MQRINLKTKLPDAVVDKLAGTKLDDSSYDLLVEGEAEVYKPDGSLLLALRKAAIPPKMGAKAYEILDRADVSSKNRGVGTGKEFKGTKAKLKDGSVSKTVQVIDPVTGKYLDVQSGIIGYFDRYTRFPYARETAYVQQKPKDWKALQPFINRVDQVFAETVPERHAIQRAVAAATDPAWVIGQTAFTTLTVNKNWQTAVHKDAGDLAEGFGVMAYLQAGALDGGYLVMPAYRVAVRLESCDVLMFNVHEWHGNTPIIGSPGKHQRITTVFYYRRKMIYCGSPEYEMERAKNCRNLGRLYDPEEIEEGESKLQKIFQSFALKTEESDCTTPLASPAL